MASSLLANRVAKASRYVDFLDVNLPVDADLDVLNYVDWEQVAELAGEQPPSEATRAAIITGLRQRRAAQAVGPHLLRGLPR